MMIVGVIHVKRDGKAIEFRDLDISPTDGNTCHTNGLVFHFSQ